VKYSTKLNGVYKLDSHLVTQVTDIINIIRQRLDHLDVDECRRLFHGRGKCYELADHFNIEKYGKLLALVFYTERDEATWVSAIGALANTLGFQFCVQRRWQNKSPWTFYDGQPADDFWVKEADAHYLLTFNSQNPGLFLDMRHGRAWLKNHSRHAKVANLFSYTCGFSVAASLGGAIETLNMDMSRAALNQGQKNLKQNQSGSKNRFLAHDISKSLGKISKLGPYDIVVIDPPTKQRSFDPISQYNRLLNRCADWVVEGGWLMLTLNDPVVTVSEFLTQVSRVLGEDFSFEQRLENPEEIEEIDSDKGLKVLLFKRRVLCV